MYLCAYICRAREGERERERIWLGLSAASAAYIKYRRGEKEEGVEFLTDKKGVLVGRGHGELVGVWSSTSFSNSQFFRLVQTPYLVFGDSLS